MQVTIIGSGNVATHLALALFNKGIVIHQIYSKSLVNAQILAKHVNAEAINDFSQLNNNFSVGIVAVSDAAIKKTIALIPHKDKLWLHTSGTTAVKVFARNYKNYGVLYPLQTFSKNKKIDFSQIPFFIEANNNESLEQIKLLVNQLSQNCIVADSKTRKALHVAAVFACNFTNHLYAVSSSILKDHNLSFDYLKPLIKETVDKAMLMEPKQAQTGPAVRNDFLIIREHKKFLNYKKQYKRLYKNLSESIILDNKKVDA